MGNVGHRPFKVNVISSVNWVKLLCCFQDEKIWVVILQNQKKLQDCRQSQYSLQIYNIHIFQFWAWILRFLFYVVSKSSSFMWLKKNRNNFSCIALLFVWVQKMCLRFLKSYFKVEIFICLPFVVSF